MSGNAYVEQLAREMLELALRPREKLVLWDLIWNSDGPWAFRLSDDMVARECGLSHIAVSRWLERLVSAGLVERARFDDGDRGFLVHIDDAAKARLVREERPAQSERSWYVREIRARLVAEFGEACAICGRTERLVVDHDHHTGLVRGLLCSTCNNLEGKGYAAPCFVQYRTDPPAGALRLTYTGSNPLRPARIQRQAVAE